MTNTKISHVIGITVSKGLYMEKILSLQGVTKENRWRRWCYTYDWMNHWGLSDSIHTHKVTENNNLNGPPASYIDTSDQGLKRITSRIRTPLCKRPIVISLSFRNHLSLSPLVQSCSYSTNRLPLVKGCAVKLSQVSMSKVKVMAEVSEKFLSGS